MRCRIAGRINPLVSARCIDLYSLPWSSSCILYLHPAFPLNTRRSHEPFSFRFLPSCLVLIVLRSLQHHKAPDVCSGAREQDIATLKDLSSMYEKKNLSGFMRLVSDNYKERQAFAASRLNRSSPNTKPFTSRSSMPGCSSRLRQGHDPGDVQLGQRLADRAAETS